MSNFRLVYRNIADRISYNTINHFMRFFIALEIPDENKQQLLEVQNQLKKIIPGIRITDNNKLHLTIAFFGEQPEGIKERLTQVMRKAAQGISAFEITPAYIDGFPSLHHPRILWAGVKGDIDKLFVLRERIKDGLMDIEIEVDERRYTPHIALGKLKDFELTESEERGLENIMSQSFGPIQIKSVKLFQSIPNHGLHQHNTLAEVHLN